MDVTTFPCAKFSELIGIKNKGPYQEELIPTRYNSSCCNVVSSFCSYDDLFTNNAF